ncbi:MAG: LptA/OstA family protein, partial [Vampirovibrionia bacterium]
MNIKTTKKLLITFILVILLSPCVSYANTDEASNIDNQTKEEDINQQTDEAPILKAEEPVIQKKEEAENQTLSASAVEVKVDSDKLEYVQEEDKFVATGSAKVIVSDQDAELTAKKITYYQKDEYITAEGDVKLVKKGKEVIGDFARINLNEKSALINNPHTTIQQVKMTAKEANLYPEYIELSDGKAILEQDSIDLTLSAGQYKPEEIKEEMPGFETVIPSDPNKTKNNYKIVAKEIVLDRSKKTNNLTVYNAKVYIGKFKLASIPKMSLTIGEQAQVVEAMMPEVGFNKNIAGVYFGPSLTLDLPKDSTLRISPIFSAAGREHVVGGGGILRFSSPFNKTNVAYTSTANRLVVDGQQKIFGETTKIKYNINDYPDKGFMGTGFYRPLYLVELVDERKVATVLNHNISTRLSGGVARDVDYGIATSRLQAQADIISNKPILQFKDIVRLRLQGQVNFAFYGTGDTYTVLRGGPRVDWKLWRLNLTTAYFQAGIWGNTPFIFDEYIRGKYNLVLAGDFKLCKYLSVGNIRSLNLGKDGAEPRFSTGNQFYARVGPEDFKFRVGYDIE